MNAENIARLQKMIDQSSSIVFLGGAGVSTESGIPDYRSVNGLYYQKFKYRNRKNRCSHKNYSNIFIFHIINPQNKYIKKKEK